MTQSRSKCRRRNNYSQDHSHRLPSPEISWASADPGEGGRRLTVSANCQRTYDDKSGRVSLRLPNPVKPKDLREAANRCGLPFSAARSDKRGAATATPIIGLPPGKLQPVGKITTNGKNRPGPWLLDYHERLQQLLAGQGRGDNRQNVLGDRPVVLGHGLQERPRLAGLVLDRCQEGVDRAGARLVG